FLWRVRQFVRSTKSMRRVPTSLLLRRTQCRLGIAQQFFRFLKCHSLERGVEPEPYDLALGGLDGALNARHQEHRGAFAGSTQLAELLHDLGMYACFLQDFATGCLFGSFTRFDVSLRKHPCVGHLARADQCKFLDAVALPKHDAARVCHRIATLVHPDLSFVELRDTLQRKSVEVNLSTIDDAAAPAHADVRHATEEAIFGAQAHVFES